MAAVGGNAAFSSESYEEGYRGLLKKTTEQLPNAKLVIGEPFLLPVGRFKDKWDIHVKELVPRQKIAHQLSQEFNAAFILTRNFLPLLQRRPVMKPGFGMAYIQCLPDMN